MKTARAGIAFALIAAPALCRGATEGISIGPEVLTFAQVATRLSAPGRAVACARGLRDQAVFVHLRNRGWESVRTILSRALGVRFKPERATASGSQTLFRIERDPEVAARETVWRRAYAAALAKRLRDDLAPRAELTRRDYADVASEYERKSKALAILHKTDPEEDRPETKRLAEESNDLASALNLSGWAIARISRGLTAADTLAAIERPQPFIPFQIGKYVDVARVMRVYQSHVVSGQLQTPEDLSTDVITEADDIMTSFARGDYSNQVRVWFDPAALQISYQVLSTVGTPGVAFREGDPTVTLAEPETTGFYQALSSAVGAEAAKELESQSALSRAFLGSAAARTPLAANQTREAASLSQIVEAWVAKTGNEAVMHLRPFREPLYEFPLEQTDTDTGAKHLSTDQTSLSELFGGKESARNWCFKVDEGVLTVIDRLSFIDSVREFPMTSFLRYEKTVAAERMRLGPVGKSHSLSAVSTFASSTTDSLAASMTLSASYRGVSTDDLAQLRAIVPLLAALPVDRRAELTDSAKWTTDLAVPLKRFDPRAVSGTIGALQALDSQGESSGFGAALNPASVARAPEWQLRISRRKGVEYGLTRFQLFLPEDTKWAVLPVLFIQTRLRQ